MSKIIKIKCLDDFFPLLYPDILAPEKNVIDILIIDGDKNSPVQVTSEMLIHILLPWRVRELRVCNIIILQVNYFYGKYREVVLPELTKVTFTRCVDIDEFVIFLLCHVPSLEFLADDGSLNVNSIQSYVDVSRTAMKQLNGNYKLHHFEHYELEMKVRGLSLTGRPDVMLCEVHKNIQVKVTRNRLGYRKCTDAVYQWLMICNYSRRNSNDNPVRLLCKNIAKMIAEMVYATIGTKVWCPTKG